MSLEKLVRPFETPATILDKRLPAVSVSKAAPKRAILFWGKVGRAPNIYSLTWTGDRPSANKLKEKSRKTTNVRVQNPNDPSQFVVEQRANSVVFGSGGSNSVVDPTTGKESIFNDFTNRPSGSGTSSETVNTANQDTTFSSNFGTSQVINTNNSGSTGGVTGNTGFAGTTNDFTVDVNAANNPAVSAGKGTATMNVGDWTITFVTPPLAANETVV